MVHPYHVALGKRRGSALVMEPIIMDEDSSREKFERDAIEILKSKQFEAEVQHATWKAGDLRKLREPVKRKGSASTSAATATPSAAAAAAPKKHGRPQLPNMDGGIASVSTKKKAGK